MQPLAEQISPRSFGGTTPPASPGRGRRHFWRAVPGFDAPGQPAQTGHEGPPSLPDYADALLAAVVKGVVVASFRSQVRMACDPEQVWALVADPARIAEWFPGVESATVEGTTRTITLRSGLPLVEEVVNVDHRLRRFQYRIVGPFPVDHHLGTVDVIDDPAGCLVVYSTEITPEPMGFVIDGATAAALDELRSIVESPTGATGSH